MKKPTIEEVKEYFKDAETVKCLSDDCVFEINLNNNFCNGYDVGVFINNCKTEGGFDQVMVWDKEKGYAKILTYKEPKEQTFVITKEQIKEINEFCLMYSKDNSDIIKQWFPKAFEEEKKELVVGKWYISDGYLINKQEGANCFGFYLYRNSWIKNVSHELSEHISGKYREATEQEVFDALKKEAVKRYSNEYLEPLNRHLFDRDDEPKDCIHSFEKNSLSMSKNEICMKYGNYYAVIFNNGQWAEIIPTISLKEAEERLNCKIV